MSPMVKAREAEPPWPGDPTPVERQRFRTAYHEAGHAAAAYLLGRGIRLVSIRPTETTLGYVLERPAQKVPKRKAGLPAILQPAAYRREVESDIVVLLSGPAAEDLAAPVTGFIGISADAAAADDAAHELAGLTERDRALLRDADGLGRSYYTDQDKAEFRARELADQEACFHLAWLNALARRLVSSLRGRLLIDTLADQLLRREVMSGREVRALFQRVDLGVGGGVRVDSLDSANPHRRPARWEDD